MYKGTMSGLSVLGCCKVVLFLLQIMLINVAEEDFTKFIYCIGLLCIRSPPDLRAISSSYYWSGEE